MHQSRVKKLRLNEELLFRAAETAVTGSGRELAGLAWCCARMRVADEPLMQVDIGDVGQFDQLYTRYGIYSSKSYGYSIISRL